MYRLNKREQKIFSIALIFTGIIILALALIKPSDIVAQTILSSENVGE